MMGKKTHEKQMIVINVILVLALLAVVFPLLLIAQYNRPSADDWSFGVYGYRILQDHGGAAKMLQAIFENVRDSYLHWEGRFAAVLFASVQPGIWGEKYYGIVAYLMIGSLIFSVMFLARTLLSYSGMGKKGEWYLIPIAAPVLIMQILYCPYPVESFYWYTGSVNYTFAFGLSLVLVALTLQLGLQDDSRWKWIMKTVAACVLAVLAGGNNFATSLSCFLLLCTLSVIFFLREGRHFTGLGQ